MVTAQDSGPEVFDELAAYQARGGIVVSYDVAVPLACDQVIFDREDNAYQGAPPHRARPPRAGPGPPPLGQSCKYLVRPISNGRALTAAATGTFALPVNAAARPYLSIPLRTPEGYTPNDASVGDLDGDGEYEIVLHQAGRGKDNSQDGETDSAILQAYKLDNTFLWSINLGRNIREGAYYTQFMVFDLDGDGRSEIVCKTADGTTDGAGAIIGDAQIDYREPSGRILRGPEFLSVLDGLSGKVLATEQYVPGRHPETQNPTGDQLKAVWDDGYGNRGDRFLACVACLDGVHPSVVMCRGYYTRTVLAPWDYRGGKLSQRCTFDTDTPGNGPFAIYVHHAKVVVDVDGDGRDEIIYGKMAVDDDGKSLYSAGIGHGDAMHVSDLDPSRPGLEVFSIQEPVGDAGVNFFDARTGEVLWKRPSITRTTGKAEGPERGLALDIDPRTPEPNVGPPTRAWATFCGTPRRT